MYFSVFSPKQVTYFLISSANSFMIKWKSIWNLKLKWDGIENPKLNFFKNSFLYFHMIPATYL